MDIKLNGHDFKYDITSVAMMFFPGEKINYVNKSVNAFHARSILIQKDNKFISKSLVFINGKVYTSTKTKSSECDIKNLVKQTFYGACSKATNIVSPWGILTGIRPLSVYARHVCDCENTNELSSFLKKEYFIDDKKISVLSKIYDTEKSILNTQSKDVSVYISIPFCPSKCTYCSFVSVAATGKTNLISQYLIKLAEEIEKKLKLIKKYNLNIKTLYIGGGTPGILECDQLDFLLFSINKYVKFTSLEEFNFELGRPDTVTDEKLEILKKYYVSRICINTQTTNDNILNNINRRHTSEDYYKAIELVKKYKFNSINTDIIAGLPNESFKSFCNTVKDVISAGVDNITIHTLAIKKSSNLSDDMTNYTPVNSEVNNMLDYAYNLLYKNGFNPYYIYRQKNCVSNGENIGFCKENKICKYNVYMMEDVHSIIACGAGASTKFINGTKVERAINVKYPMEYVREYEKVENNIKKTENLLKVVLTDDNA